MDEVSSSANDVYLLQTMFHMQFLKRQSSLMLIPSGVKESFYEARNTS